MVNTGSSILDLDVDTAPTPAISGFPPGISGARHADDGVAQTAQADLTTAYNAAASAPSTDDETGVDLGGQVLTQGVYTASSDMSLTGSLPLTLSGSASSVFIFQAGTTLITGSDSSVLLTGGVLACNVFWQVGTSATLGTGTEFQGNILALTSITVNANSTIAGRALSRNGEVSLMDDTFTAPSCDTTTPTPPTTTPVPPTTTAPPITAAPPTTAAPPATTAAPITTAVPVGTKTPAPGSLTTPVTLGPIQSTTTPAIRITTTTLGTSAVGAISVGSEGGGGATLLTTSPSTTLAFTGLNTRPLLALGVGSALTGAALVLTARRRRNNA